jgi:hypothetical protein
MRRLLTFFAALSLAVPAVAGAPGVDGYRFEGAEYQRSTVSVQFIGVATQAELEAHGRRYGVSLKKARLKGFAVRLGSTCAIYMVDPKIQYEPEFLGHELTHCIFGDFHPEQSKGIK